MNMSLKTGTISINQYGDDHYDIGVNNRYDKSISNINFITKDELRKIKNQISSILKDDNVS